MDPLTILAIAQVAVAGVQLVQNYFAGQANIAGERSRLKEQRDMALQRAGQQKSFLEQQKALADKSTLIQGQTLDANVAQAQKDLTQGVASTSAGLAQSGVQGPMAQMIADQAKADGQAKIDRAYTDGSNQIMLQKQNADLQFAENSQRIADGTYDINQGYTSGMNDLQSQQDQFNMDTLMNGIGVGISAFSTLSKANWGQPKSTGNGFSYQDQTDLLKYRAKGGKGAFAY